jgi:DNA-binding response OmpR family regulator
VTSRVLVVEDDPDIWRTLQILLERSMIEASWAGDGPSGLRLYQSWRPDLVVLDIGLPGVDGWDVLDRIRQHGDTPVLVLTARGLDLDKARGLRSGADGYLTKPFGNDELVARVQGLLRRGPEDGSAAETRHGPIYDDGHLRVDLIGGTATVDGVSLALTPIELRLLASLVRHPGEVMSPAQLLEQAWRDPTGTGLAKVKSTVLSLRRKLGDTDIDGTIETVRGFGYRYRPTRR